ncbi:CRISPR locus-related DNA-binding protein [Candidatus Woesearchaeota archaeon]|nr:CRISPR locus-related DNA-binding protein [Candidatus Woesearchaeota archaeon]
MTKILIATLYVFEPIIASATKMSADRLILLIDKKPDKKQLESLEILKKSLGSVMEITTIETEVCDIVKVAKETVKIIDLLSDKDEIYIDITAGRKTKALGLLFGSYARTDRVKRIMYVKEEDKSIISLPKLSYAITPGQNKIVHYLHKNSIVSMIDLANKIDISRAMLYKHIKELKDMDVIENTKDGLQLTDYGRIVVL